MPNIIQTSNLVNENFTVLTLPGFFETVFVVPGVTVGTTNIDTAARAIHMTNSGQSAMIAGTVVGSNGIWSDNSFSEVNVVAGGIVAASVNALRFNFAHAIVRNDGTIQSSGWGINHRFGATIENTGTISASIAIDSGGLLTLFNSGTIIGSNWAIYNLGNFADTVINAGTIRGGIDLEGGTDFFDGSDGRTFGMIILGSGADSALGGIGREVFVDGDGADDIDAGAGADDVRLSPDNAADTLDGGAGIDTLDLRGNLALATITDLGQGFSRGNLIGNNLIAGFERVVGSDGLDRVTGNGAANTFFGNAGNDLLSGGDGDDLLIGGAGVDLLDGGAGNDRLIGGETRDTLTGGAGNDLIWGGETGDTMTGGLGADRFLFAQIGDFEAVLGFPDDRITDFTPGTDIIDLSRIDWNFTGPDNAFAFQGTAGISAAGQVAVRQEGGATLVDVSWSGGAPGSIITDTIRLDGLLTLAAADFWL